MNQHITDTQMAEMFRKWWMESYPTPPGNHALMTHMGWGRHLLTQVDKLTNKEGSLG